MSAGDDLLDRFVAFSATATAFSDVDLRGTGQAAAYLATAREQAGEAILRELLDASEQGQAGGDVFADEKLGPLARNIIKMWYSGVWYELPPDWAARYGAPVPGMPGVPAQRQPGQQDLPGQHLPPGQRRTLEQGAAGHELAASKGPLEQQGRQRTPARTASFVVCPAAYTEGLLWRAIGAHPAGAKAPGYGSWAAPPLIEGYTDDDAKGGPQ